MNNSWIKLYRKTIENGILMDHSAWAVFSWLLLMVDKDTGKRTIGRFQMADELKIKPNTLYKILHRLEKKWKVIQLTSQMKYTEISILNWTKYQMTVKQESNDSQTPVKYASPAGNTKQEIENRELRIEKESTTSQYLLEVPDEDVYMFTHEFVCTPRQVQEKARSLNDYCESNGKKYKNYKAFLRNAIRKDFGERKFPEQSSGAQYETDPNGVARLKEMKESLMKRIN